MLASSRSDIFLQQKQFILLVPEQQDIEEVFNLSLRPLNLSTCFYKHVKVFQIIFIHTRKSVPYINYCSQHVS